MLPSASNTGAAPPNALFAEMLRAARELLAVRSPLDAELMVSELLGTWWGERLPRNSRGDVEELVGEGLVSYAAQQRSPAALALLSGVACLGTPRQAMQAETAALALIARGVVRPPWAEHMGAVTAGECYVNSDAFGDRDEVVCVFSYAGEEPHALVMVVNYNAGGMLRDGWVTSQVDRLLERCRAAGDGDGRQPARATFSQVEAPQARRLLETALAVTEAGQGTPPSDSFASYHAFIRARIRTLPPARPGRGARSGTGRPAAGSGTAAGPAPWSTGHGSGWGAATTRRHAWTRDRRAMLVAEFLASDEAEDLSDTRAASRCADHIIDYGCDRDFGRPLRMSPAKVATFLLDWLPRKVLLLSAEQHAMPHVLAAWVRWTGRRQRLAAEMIAETLDAVFDSMGTFAQVYQDPTAFGLDAALVSRLLPDDDLEALPRRAFAFPVLRGMFGGVDLAGLDPAEESDRRTLLAADHNDANGRPSGPLHIDRHLTLADQLWRGDPPELWEAAQRLLDRGEDRHAVLHTLMYVIRDTAGDQASLIAALRDLPPAAAD